MGSLDVYVTGDRETFFIKVLVKKLRDHGISAGFVPAPDMVATGYADAGIVVYYMEEGEKLPEDYLDFFREKILSDNKKFILIGLPEDTAPVTRQLPKGAACSVYDRPLEDEKLIEDLSLLLNNGRDTELKKSILIVDDEPGYMSLVREWLKESYRVSMVTDGEQAFKWLAHNKGDLVLLDYEMPVLSGPEVLKRIKEDPTSRDIPVFFLTGRSENEIDSIESELANGVIFKTITKDELLIKLKSFFTK